MRVLGQQVTPAGAAGGMASQVLWQLASALLEHLWAEWWWSLGRSVVVRPSGVGVRASYKTEREGYQDIAWKLYFTVSHKDIAILLEHLL